MAYLAPNPRQKFTDINGAPLAGGKLYTYQAGTSTPVATYTDITEATPNANPIILDANGECDVWIGTSSYKFVLKDSSDVVQWTTDNISMYATGSIGTVQLANGSVTTIKIADNAITAAKIPDASIVTAKIADNSIIGSKLTASVVTTTKIADATITTAKIADAQITKAKLAALGQQLSSSSGTFSTSSSSLVDVTNLTCTITTTGRPVKIELVPDGTTNTGYIENDTGSSSVSIALNKGGTIIGQANIAPGRMPVSVCSYVDVPAAGTYTYKIQAARDVLVAGNTHVYYAKLLVYEL